jgi:ABC-type lipoprotein release transport system permease subunit
VYGMRFDLALGQGGDEVPDRAVRALEDSPDVAAVTLYGTGTIVLGTRSLDLVGMQPVVGDLLPEVLEGRLPVGEDEVMVGPVAARELEVDVGDELTGSGATGERTLRVTGIGLIPGVAGADVLGQIALVTAEGLARIDPASTMAQVTVDVADDAPPGASARIAELTGMAAGQLDPPPAVVNLRRVRTVPVLVAMAVGALGTLSLAHLMLVAVRRRRRDFAVLRAVGAPRGWLSRVVHWQATVTTLVILCIAVPAGGLAGSSLYRRFADHLGARPDSILPVADLALGLVALLALANVVAAVVAHRVRRDLPAEALALPA